MKPHPRNRPNRRNVTKFKSNDADGPIWLWGIHAVMAALANPDRKIQRICVTKNAASRLSEISQLPTAPEELLPKQIDELLPRDAVHQGMAILTEPLAEQNIEDVLGYERVVVFDQLTDPHNIGAIFRSASAFGFEAAILQSRNVPPITGVVAKTAAGAIESVREVRAVNIARAIDTLKDAGFHTVGLDGGGSMELREAVSGAPKLALVIGAEGSGLRPNVASACDVIASIPISNAMESLNASNAAAIAFYESTRADLG
tara:strand:- start:33643 stop:34419 length:777 start_codon:yes stop_codon:yes gene_type:complete